MARYNNIYRKLNNTYLNNAQVPKSKARMKMCLSKIGYDTKFEAENEAAKRNQRAYKCDFCEHWHTTKQKAERHARTNQASEGKTPRGPYKHYCTKHQLFHGKRYQSCTPRGELDDGYDATTAHLPDKDTI